MINRLRRRLGRLVGDPGSSAAISDLYARYDALALELRDLNAMTTNDSRADIDRGRDEIDHDIGVVEARAAAFEQHIRTWVPEYIDSVRVHLETHAGDAVDHATSTLKRRMRRVELAVEAAPHPADVTGIASPTPQQAPTDAAALPAKRTPSASLGYDYSAFEDELRGSPEHVKALESPHVTTISDFGAAELPVLDVGCGRGELIELLTDAGIAARGIDLNPVSVAECVAAGLDVVEGDAVGFLTSLEPASLRAVVGLHIVEHMADGDRAELFRAAHRAVAPGGGVIFETPNPENLRVGSTSFWLDPTHLRPIPPQLLEFQVTQAGFDDVSIQRLHPSDDAITVADDADPLAVQLAELVNRLVAGPMDYAVVGRRSVD